MRTLANSFKETKEKVEITMGGWDGTGYNGEGKKMNVWTSETAPDKKFVCKWMARYKQYCLLVIDFDSKHEKTGLPTVSFYNSFSADCMRK